MATSRFAISSGNFSDPSIWDNGVVPGIDDIVYANSHTITLDQNINVVALRNSTTPIYVPDIATPIMTSNTEPSGVASTSVGSSNAWVAFDQSLGNVIDFGTATARSINYQFPASKIIKRYAIRGDSTQSENPRIWTFDGSDDGITWTTLHSVSLSTAIGANAWYDSGILPNTTPYLHYRVNITATGGGNLDFVALQMTESTAAINGGGSNGQFIVNSGITINCTSISNGSTTPTIDITTTDPVYINADIYGSTGDTIRLSVVGSVYIVGDLYGTTVSNNSSPCVRLNSTGYINIIGDAIIRTGSANVIIISQAGTLDFTGNIEASLSTANSDGIEISQPATVNFVGNFNISPTNINNIGIRTSSSPTINITGNVTGGQSSSGNIAVYLSGGATVNITGNVIGGLNSGSNYGVYTFNASPIITIYGDVIANVAPGIASNGFNLHTVYGNLVNNGNRMAAFVASLYLVTNQWQFSDPSNNPFSLYSATAIPGMPSESNVILGTVYGPSNELTGTYIVPDPSNVRKGVLVGVTQGTAELTADDFLTTLSTSTDPLAERLRNVVTSNILGNQLAAFTN